MSAADDRLRWGILATGGIAHTFATDLRRERFDLVAVASRTQTRADAFAAEFGLRHAHGDYAAMAADPDVDVVYIATPHAHHLEPALAMIAAGKHVLVEKAFTLDRASAERIRSAAAEHGVLAAEAMWTRYLPHMPRLRELVVDGAIGEVRALSAAHTQSLPDDPAHRLNALELGGGALLDLGVYPVSFAWDVLGEPATIAATGRLKETGADAETAIQFGYPDGAAAQLYCASTLRGRNRATVLGSQRSLEIDEPWTGGAVLRHFDADGSLVEEYRSTVAGTGMQFEAAAVERAVATGSGPVELDLDETVEIMGCLDEIRRQIGVRYPTDAF